MRIAICGNDTLLIQQLECYIRTFFLKEGEKCPKIDRFSDGESLLADKKEKDLIFLGIEMPGINGIHVGTELKSANDRAITLLPLPISNIWTMQGIHPLLSSPRSIFSHTTTLFLPVFFP